MGGIRGRISTYLPLTIALVAWAVPCLYLIETKGPLRAPAMTLLTTGLTGLFFLALVHGGSGNIRRGLRLFRTETSAVESAEPGAIELDGLVESDEKIIDRPFVTGDCVCTDYSVNKDSIWSRSRSTVLDETISVPFYLDDGTGTILVDPGENANLDCSGPNEMTVEDRPLTGSHTPQTKEFHRSRAHSENPHDGDSGDELERIHRQDLNTDNLPYREGDYTYKSEVVRPLDNYIVFGKATRREAGGSESAGDLVVKPDDTFGEVFISDRDSSSSVGWGLLRTGILETIVGILFGVGSIAFLYYIPSF